MPGTYGFAGQRDDTAVTGLDYDTARYYDPTIGQFTSADTMADGLNRFGYVGATRRPSTDPSGALAVQAQEAALTLPQQAQALFDYLALNPTASNGMPSLLYLQINEFPTTGAWRPATPNRTASIWATSRSRRWSTAARSRAATGTRTPESTCRSPSRPRTSWPAAA